MSFLCLAIVFRMFSGSSQGWPWPSRSRQKEPNPPSPARVQTSRAVFTFTGYRTLEHTEVDQSVVKIQLQNTRPVLISLWFLSVNVLAIKSCGPVRTSCAKRQGGTIDACRCCLYSVKSSRKSENSLTMSKCDWWFLYYKEPIYFLTNFKAILSGKGFLPFAK